MHRRRIRDQLQYWSARLFSVALVVSVMASGTTSVAAAQKENFTAGFLVQPSGARSVGHGETAVADTTLGTEGLWWNPAAMARMRKREVAVHHAQSFQGNADILAFAYPSKALGTIAASVFLLNLGDQVHTDSVGNDIGLLTSRYYVLSAGYATPVGKHFSAGLTAKTVLVRLGLCSGCPPADVNNNQVGSAYALDIGAQYILPIKTPLVFGASVRNLGTKLQTKDEAQADPLPRVLQVGVQGQVPLAALKKNLTTLDLRADVFATPAYTAPSIRVGADLSYQDLYTIRAGYKHIGPNDGVEGGLTAGVGIKYNSFQFDLARRFDASSNSGFGDSGAPTYVSLRYVW